jgi:diguanylate cyclase (GGDEF)-like protein
VFATGKALLVLDATNSDVFQDRGDPAKVAPGSFMLVPIKYKTESGCKILGVLNIRSRHPRAFRDEDLQHLETLAGILANKLRLAKLINMDGLTEVLYQRKPGVEKLDAMLAVAHQKKIPLAFLMLDLDYFKHINDTYEHSGGDAALRGTAEVIHRFILSHKEELKDHVEIRWGGDELAVVLFGVDRRRAQELAEELREKISQKIYTIYGEEFSLTTSIGIAIWPMHGSSSEALSKNADKAAYRSKRDGRNRVIIFNPEDREMRETIVPK